jgi:hypothetical protein
MADLVKKEVKYLNKDFAQFRRNLINFAKNYFPQTYNDFNETSPGMMFIEMAAYIGDVLSYYTDTTLRESLVSEANEKANLYLLSQLYGYKPKRTAPANVMMDIYQLVPSRAKSVGGNLGGDNNTPDYRYALSVKPGAQISTETGEKFRSLQPVEFGVSSSFDPTDVSVYETDAAGNVTYYLLKKQVPAVSGLIKTKEFIFEDPKPYDKIVLPEDDINVIDIIDIYDTDGNRWHEVDYLAQDTIYEDIQNISYNDPDLSNYKSTVPYILKLKRTPRRFVKRLREDDRMEIQFGAGVSSDADEDLIPNPKNVGMGLSYLARTIDQSLDPSNFLYTSTYGLAPNSTTLTVRYSVGGGLKDNVSANTLVQIDSVEYHNFVNEQLLDATLMQFAKDSIVMNNPNPAMGGRSAESLDNVRQNAMATFAAQNRTVTKEDYIVRAYSMPQKYGMIAKAYIIRDDQIDTSDQIPPQDRISNPMALNLYTLGYDQNKKLMPCNTAVKENLRTYLSQYRVLTDAINIKDGFIVNIGIDFEIITLPNYNSNETLLRCIEYLKRKFDIDNMQINAPILISSCMAELDQIEGVQTVVDFGIKNFYDTEEGYSGNVYDIAMATKNNIVYPSLDPCIFEIRYPDQDIRGRVTTI